jgi:hypothetical protein
MNNLQKHNLIKVAPFLLYIFALSIRLPGAVFPPEKAYYNVIDERYLANSTVALFGGQIPFTLAWPSGTLMAPLMALYSLDFLISHPAIWSAIIHKDVPVVLDELSQYIARFFMDPTRQLIAGRILVTIIASLASPILFWFLSDRAGTLGAIAGGLMIASSPFFVQQSHQLMSDAPATTFWLISLVSLMSSKKPQKDKAIASGLFLGLSVASKFIYAAFVPVALFALCIARPKTSEDIQNPWWMDAVLFLIWLFIPLLIFVPFIWTAPLTMAKSFLGSLALRQSGAGNSWWMLLSVVLPSLVNWGGMVLSIIGIFYSFFALERASAILLVAALIVFLLPVGQASLIYSRYALPLLPLLCIYAGLGVLGLSRIPQRAIRLTVISLSLAGIISWNIIDSLIDFRSDHIKTNISACTAWVNEHVDTGAKLAVPAKIGHLFVPDEVSLKRTLEYLQDPHRVQDRVSALLISAEVTEDKQDLDSPLVFSAFGDDERQKIFAIQTMVWYLKRGLETRKHYDLWVYRDKLNYLTPEIRGFEEIVSRFSEGEIEVIVSDRNIPYLDDYIVESFNSYHGARFIVYRMNEKPQP